MELIRGLHNLKPQHQHCVVTIGNFDGVHLGHQALLKKLIAKGKELNLPTVAIIFESQPNEYFYKDKIPARLMRLREKIRALEKCGIDRVLCLRFNKDLADLSAENFIQNILWEKLRVHYVVIGDDFRFGHFRKGDFAMLQKFGENKGFTVEKMPTLILAGQRVSSTRIREALAAGDLLVAEKLLTRPFVLSGRVAHGDKRGRIIGFPTANIYLHRKAVPILGVYVVQVHGLDAKSVKGVANVGNRPTVGGVRSLLEVHLFDFDDDIYGKHVDVEFIKKLRDEKKFDSVELLKEQIMQDAEEARKYFAPPGSKTRRPPP